MSTLTDIRQRLLIKFVFPRSTSNPGQICKMRITAPETVPMQIENATGTVLDNGRDPVSGDKEQPSLPYGV